MAAANAREEGVIAGLRRTMGHVSAERVISGPGLVNIYRSLCELDGEPRGPDLAPNEVSARALAGACPRAGEALEMFCAMLGTVASNLALSLGARGGVYNRGGNRAQAGPRVRRIRISRALRGQGAILGLCRRHSDVRGDPRAAGLRRPRGGWSGRAKPGDRSPTPGALDQIAVGRNRYTAIRFSYTCS